MDNIELTGNDNNEIKEVDTLEKAKKRLEEDRQIMMRAAKKLYDPPPILENKPSWLKPLDTFNDGSNNYYRYIYIHSYHCQNLRNNCHSDKEIFFVQCCLR